MSIQPPVAKRVPLERTHHGDTVVDHYEWLRNKEDPEVIAYLDAENAYTAERTAGSKELQDTIVDEIRARTQETDLSVPTRRGEFWYYSRTAEGSAYSLECRCPVAGLDEWTPPAATVPVVGELVLLDSNVEAQDHDYYDLGALSVSRDGRTLAYSTDTDGDERYSLRFKDLVTGTLLDDTIANTTPDVAWSQDGRYLFYVTLDGAARPDRVWRHEIGASVDADVEVFHEPDEAFWVDVSSTRSGRYLTVSSDSETTSEVLVLDVDDVGSGFRVLLPRVDGVQYSVEHAVVHGEHRFLFLHNGFSNGAKAENFVLTSAPVDDPTDQVVVVPHRRDVRLDAVYAFAGHLVLWYRRDALPRLAISSTDDVEFRELTFDEELFRVRPGANPEWAQPGFRFTFTSLVTPVHVYDYDFVTGESLLRKAQPVLGGFDSNDYVQHREWAIADDGTRVPLSIVHHRDVPNGPAPTVLYGYGAYESSMDPALWTDRLSLLDRGFVLVTAHVRGGGEMGRYWYDQGKVLNKKNTFTDFICVARHLVGTGRTSPSLLVASGGSAGGLVMGVAANLAPELFAAVVAIVPFVDPLTSMLDPTLPLTVNEWDEWGNPLADSEVYHYAKSYSPYENVAAQDYPAMLVTTSLNDTRVLYVEPAKWVAALRAAKTGDSELLLRIDMNAGHGGASGRYAQWEDDAFVYAWIVRQIGALHSR